MDALFDFFHELLDGHGAFRELGAEHLSAPLPGEHEEGDDGGDHDGHEPEIGAGLRFHLDVAEEMVVGAGIGHDRRHHHLGDVAAEEHEVDGEEEDEQWRHLPPGFVVRFHLDLVPDERGDGHGAGDGEAVRQGQFAGRACDENRDDAGCGQEAVDLRDVDLPLVLT